MVVDHKYQYLVKVKQGLSVVVYPLQSVVNLPREIGAWFSENLSSRGQLLEQNVSLRAESLFLNVRLQKLDVLAQENRRLRELLSTAADLKDERFQVAQIIAIAQEPFTQRVTLDKGLNDQVYIGQAVLDAFGVFGQIIAVGQFSSTCLLITDASHSIPVQNNRTGYRAILKGRGLSGELELQHIMLGRDIKQDDLLVASGLGGVFPAGFPVAIVQTVDFNNKMDFAAVRVRHLAHIERSKEVLLVWPQDDQP